jgi:hypothetical protein
LLSTELSYFSFSFFVEVGLCSLLTKGKSPNRFRKNNIPFLRARSSACLWDEQAAADRAISSTRGACAPKKSNSLDPLKQGGVDRAVPCAMLNISGIAA